MLFSRSTILPSMRGPDSNPKGISAPTDHWWSIYTSKTGKWVLEPFITLHPWKVLHSGFFSSIPDFPPSLWLPTMLCGTKGPTLNLDCWLEGKKKTPPVFRQHSSFQACWIQGWCLCLGLFKAPKYLVSAAHVRPTTVDPSFSDPIYPQLTLRLLIWLAFPVL